MPQKFEFEIWNSKIKRENRTENVKEKEKEMGLLGWNQRVLAHFPTSIVRPSSILFAGVTYAWDPPVSAFLSLATARTHRELRTLRGRRSNHYPDFFSLGADSLVHMVRAQAPFLPRIPLPEPVHQEALH